MTSTKILGIACVAVLTASSTAWAQRWGRGNVPRDGVCFYEDANYGGDYFCVDSGRSVGSIGRDMNDRISSIRIYGRAEVTVFRDRGFNGRSTRFDHNVRNLRDEGWNDTISSLQVHTMRDGRDYDRREYGRGRNSSIDVERIITRAYQDLLGRDPDPEGMRVYRSHMIDDGWSEAQVRDTLRRSQEYRERNTMTVAKAQDIVRRAYLNVLKREPDAGSRTYVDKVMRDRWTQADVERELRNSPEYRRGRR